MKQLEIPFPEGKEAESYRYVKDITGDYIYVKLKDRYDIQVGDYVQINGKEIGLVEKVMKSLIIMAYVWHGEKISIEKAYYVPEVHKFEKLSKYRISELENICKKHGYIIKGFEKVPYKARNISVTISNKSNVAEKIITYYKGKKQELTIEQLNDRISILERKLKLNKLV